jgi:hypothetical protein
MKSTTALIAFFLLMGSASAGMMPMWQDYYSLNTKVSKLLEEKKSKLSPQQYQKYSDSLKDGYKKMDSGVGRMTREDYYKMGDVEFKKVRQINDELAKK